MKPSPAIFALLVLLALSVALNYELLVQYRQRAKDAAPPAAFQIKPDGSQVHFLASDGRGNVIEKLWEPYEARMIAKGFSTAADAAEGKIVILPSGERTD